jgi:hypothetical protein
LAVDVWRQAYSANLPLKLSTVERRLAELRGHPRACGCGLCTAARQTSARELWPTVWVLAASVTAAERKRRSSVRLVLAVQIDL